MTAAAVAGRVRRAVADVPDPELPAVTIEDLGVLRDVRVDAAGHVTVELTPTYSGCPAMDTIRADVLDRLRAHGWYDAEVALVLRPRWSTTWITAAGRRKLREHGIAPPPERSAAGPTSLVLSVRCPRCGSPATAQVSRFGSTPCTAVWRCRDCLEHFPHVKVL